MKKLIIEQTSDNSATLEDCIELIYQLAAQFGSRKVIVIQRNDNNLYVSEPYANSCYTVGYRKVLYLVDNFNSNTHYCAVYTNTSYWFSIVVRDIETFYNFLLEKLQEEPKEITMDDCIEAIHALAKHNGSENPISLDVIDNVIYCDGSYYQNKYKKGYLAIAYMITQTDDSNENFWLSEGSWFRVVVKNPEKFYRFLTR